MAGNNAYYVSLTGLAQQERDDIVEWYEEGQAGLGERWLADFGRLLDRLEYNPLMYPAYLYFVHRAQMKRFPFAVFFVPDIVNHEVEILAIRHISRDPDDIRKLINA